MRATATKKLLENKQLWNGNYFLITASSSHPLLGSLRSCDGNCNENVTLKVFYDYLVLITLYEIGELHFRLLGTNGFHDKAKSERFTAASSRCRQNLKCENFTSPFGRLRQNIAPKSVPHVQHDCFSLFNQSNHWFVALSLTLPSSNLKLPIADGARGNCTGRSAVEVNIDNDRFAFVCSRWR